MQPIEGFYYDPLHGNCLREIHKKEGHANVYDVIGAYGDDEPPHLPGEGWVARLAKTGNFLSVDFLKKTVNHHRLYSALYCPTKREIHWEDGNVWLQLYA